MMQQLVLSDNVDFGDTSYYKRARVPKPGDGGGIYPNALSTVTMQYNMRQAPSRGMAEMLYEYRRNPWLQKCLRVIARKQAEVSWALYARPNANTGKRDSLRKFLRRKGQFRLKSVAKALDTGELQEIENHPLLDLWENPNPVFGGMLLRELWASYLTLVGETFTLKRRDTSGIVYELWPIPPTWVFRTPTTKNPTFEISALGRTILVPMEDMMWFKHPELLNPYSRGTGTGESLGSYIDTDHYAMEFQKAFFYNNARPNMMLFMPGADEDTVLDFQTKLEDATRGSLRAHRPLIYQGANKIEVQEFDTSKGMESSIPLLQHDRDTFVSVFGVPPELVGILQNANRSTIDVAETIMARNVTAPACEFMADEMQRDLLQEFDQGEGKLLFTYENPVPDDADFQLQVLGKAPWIASANEWRKLGGLPDQGKDGDYYMVPSLYTATDDPATPIEKPQPMGGGFGAGGQGQQQGHAPPNTQPQAGHASDDDDDKADASDNGSKKKSTFRDFYVELTKAWDDEEIEAKGRAKQVINAIKPKVIQNQLDPEWQARVDEWGNQAFEDLGVKPAFDVYNENVKKHLEDFSSTRITNINDTTRSAVAKALGEGVDAGEGVDDLAKRVSDVFANAEGYRAQLIARTETVRSANFASLQGFKQTGLVPKKKWIGTMDDEIRDKHAKLSEDDPIDINDTFKVGNYEADAPGDFGAPEMDCNCRCAVGPVVGDVTDDDMRPEDLADERGDNDDEGKSLRGVSKAMRQMTDEMRWKRFDKQALDWEKTTVELLKKAFDTQKAAALSALRS